jgi:protein-disulfide isomerase
MKSSPALAAALVVLTATLSGQMPAATPPPAPQAPLTQQQGEEMLRELRSIRMLLERLTTPRPSSPPQPQIGRITNLKGYALGRPDAPLTMIEFTDLQCPFCRQFILTSFEDIRKNWIDTGKLRYISRDFPIADLHAHALAAARAVRCAGDQGKFWEMRLSLLRNANVLSPPFIQKTAEDLKLDTKVFATCAASNMHDAESQAEMEEGTRLGVGGTPTFVIGRTTPTGVEGPILVGALPYAQFDAKLKELAK